MRTREDVYRPESTVAVPEGISVHPFPWTSDVPQSNFEQSELLYAARNITVDNDILLAETTILLIYYM